MDTFGDTDPRKMPDHLFHGCIELNYETAIPGNPGLQNYSVCPRHWYIDADFKCDMCGQNFTWFAEEQKSWFEDWNFWVDSQPKQCRHCRRKKREAKGTPSR